MGWVIIEGASKKSVIAERVADQCGSKSTHKTLAHCVRGNVLWMVRAIFTDGVETDRFIECDLLGTDGRGNWGYKDMEESMGPYFYSCPASYLDLVPVVTSQEWRDKVLARAARQSRKLVVGKTYQLLGCVAPTATIESLKPLIGRCDGGRYALKRRLIGEEVTPEPACI